MSDFIPCPQCGSEQCIDITTKDLATWLKCADCGCIFDSEYVCVVSTLCQD